MTHYEYYLENGEQHAIEVESDAIGARIGDRIYDKSKGRIGEVVKEGQSGNYNIIYVDFGGKSTVRVNPMDDAQVRGRFFLVAE